MVIGALRDISHDIEFKYADDGRLDLPAPVSFPLPKAAGHPLRTVPTAVGSNFGSWAISRLYGILTTLLKASPGMFSWYTHLGRLAACNAISRNHSTAKNVTNYISTRS